MINNLIQCMETLVGILAIVGGIVLSIVFYQFATSDPSD